MNLRVALRGISEVQHHLRETGENATDLQPAFRHIAQVIAGTEEKRFASHPFAPLRDSTIRRKQRAGMSQPTKPLVGTGRLRASLTRLHDPDQVLDVTPTLLRFGSRLFYARFHADRPPLAYTPTMRAATIRTIRNFLIHGVATDRRL